MRNRIVVFVLLLGGVSFGQKESGNQVTLDLCGLDVFVGMPKSAAIDAISKVCTMKKVQVLGPDTWVIANGNEGKGLVEFRNGRVSEARVSWRSAAPDTSAGIVQAIIKAVDKITASSNTGVPATVKSVIRHDQGSDYFSFVVLLQNGRRLDIHLLQEPATSKVMLLDIEEAIH